jgi:hypothetical protein
MKLIIFLASACLALFPLGLEAFADDTAQDVSIGVDFQKSSTDLAETSHSKSRSVSAASFFRAGEVSARIGNHFRVLPGGVFKDLTSEFSKFELSMGLGLFLSESFLLELTLDRVEDDYLRDSRWGVLATFQHSHLQLSGGLHTESFDPDEVTSAVQMQAQVGVGSVWRIRKLFFGAEWFGLSIPLGDISRVERYFALKGSARVNAEGREKFYDTPAVRFLNLSFGFLI